MSIPYIQRQRSCLTLVGKQAQAPNLSRYQDFDRDPSRTTDQRLGSIQFSQKLNGSTRLLIRVVAANGFNAPITATPAR
jgi:hypothetical protein